MVTYISEKFCGFGKAPTVKEEVKKDEEGKPIPKPKKKKNSKKERE